MNNDPATSRKGFIQEIEELKKVISELLVREQVYKAKATVWGIVGGIVVTGIFKLIAIALPFIR